MNIQFLLCTNPNMPEQGEYILHNKMPRFLAKVEDGALTLISKFDGDEVDYSGKLKRAWDWYQSTKAKKK